jgi:hypothetical protein
VKDLISTATKAGNEEGWTACFAKLANVARHDVQVEGAKPHIPPGLAGAIRELLAAASPSMAKPSSPWKRPRRSRRSGCWRSPGRPRSASACAAPLSGDAWTYDDESKMGGQRIKSRFVIKQLSPDSYTFKWELQGEGGAWNTVMEGKSTRKK